MPIRSVVRRWRVLLLLSSLAVLAVGCSRSVTLQASSTDVLADLDALNQQKSDKEAALWAPMVGGMLIADGMTKDQKPQEKSPAVESAILGAAMAVGVVAHALSPAPQLESFTLTDYRKKATSRQAEFSREGFSARIKVKAQTGSTTRIQLKTSSSSASEKPEQAEQDFLQALQTLGQHS